MSFFMLLSNLFLSLVIISYYMKLIILIFLGTESESFSINRNFTYSFMQAKSICNHNSYIRADLSYSPLGYFKSEQAPIFTILNYIKLRNMDFFVVLFVLASVLVL